MGKDNQSSGTRSIKEGYNPAQILKQGNNPPKQAPTPSPNTPAQTPPAPAQKTGKE